MKRWCRYSLILMILLLGALPATASHIVGGDFTYKCLGPTGNGSYLYEVRLDIYQDCISGLPAAIAEDNPAFFGVFDAVTGLMVDTFNVSLANSIMVPPNFSNDCINQIPPICLRRATFITSINLPQNTGGYKIVYQRCCRNSAILNILNPANVGATYEATIPPVSVASCNNSAVFRNYPPQIICINNPLFYDHSAVDPDGDSLSYEFCTSYVGGSTTDAKPIPSAPPYQPVTYAPNFSAQVPMAGNPVIQIHPVTGMISGTTNLIGRFVVTVCCHEWRNGVIINTVKREFQFEVTNCSKAVVANIPQYSEEFNTYIVNCEDYTVKFDNLSTGGFDYSWDFGVPNMQNDTSDQFEPVFTYPDTGTYVVKLVVNRGSTCPDSIQRFVKVYPVFKGDFSVGGLECPGVDRQFTDLSTSTYTPVSFWVWNFDDGFTSTDQHPVHVYDSGGLYNVTLISGNQKGCLDTVQKEVFVEDFRPFAGNDTVIVKGEYINYRARGGVEYTWTPGTNLSDTTIRNPVGFYPEVGEFSYHVHIKSAYSCEGDDTINVRVVNQSSVFVPTGFTPNGDGRNDKLRPLGVGYRNINYFRVFNRWGQQVFYTTQFDEGWDGTINGVPQDLGTYFWILSLTNRFGKEEVIKGDSALLR